MESWSRSTRTAFPASSCCRMREPHTCTDITVSTGGIKSSNCNEISRPGEVLLIEMRVNYAALNRIGHRHPRAIARAPNLRRSRICAPK
jgi:hypothetical protein